MYVPKSLYATLALEVIQTYTLEGDIRIIKKREIPEELAVKRACFVSIHLKDGSLRGCIGTIEPIHENLQEEIISNAVSAASRDSRFSPIDKSELENIEVSVDVLSTPLDVKSIEELDPAIYGVIVSDRNYRRGVLLPGIEGVDTVEEQLRIVKRKAGIYEKTNEKLQIKKFTSVRYH